MCLSAFALLTFTVAFTGQTTRPYPRAELLVEASALMRAKPRERVRIVDARTRSQYQAGHVPGAVWVNHGEWSQTFGRTQEGRTWEKHLGDLGINADSRVVVYDGGSLKDAARIWWILRYCGVAHAALLNGGWPAWKEAGGLTSREESHPQAIEARLRPRAETLATKRWLLEKLPEHQWQIVDARSRGEFCGEEKLARRSGAMPGAIHLEWSDLLDPRTHRFKSADELQRLFREAGIDLKRPAVTHCQSGGRSSLMAFGLELMGVKDVRNYYRSWQEWGNADDTPVVTPQTKK